MAPALGRPGWAGGVHVDFHQRTTPAYAVQLARELAPVRPVFVEDPVRAENVSEFAYLRCQIRVPVATGEQLPSKWAFRELVERTLSTSAASTCVPAAA